MKARAASQDAEDTDQRLPAFRLLSSFVKEGKSKWRVVDSEEDFSQFAPRLARTSDADRVVRALALSAPATAGEGDHWSSRSERTVVEGAPDAELRFRCRKILFAGRSERTCLDTTKTLALR